MPSVTRERVQRNVRRGLSVSSGGVLDPSLLEAPTSIDVEDAAGVLADVDYVPARFGLSGRERHSVVVITPGTLALAFVNPVLSETEDPPPPPLPPSDGLLLMWATLGYVEEVSENVRAAITEWSAKSRANMLRTIASLDITPLTSSPYPLGMVTLTLPGEWLSVAPDARAWARLVRAWQKRFARAFGYPIIGLWKREFQRRGAPHLHVLMAVPVFVPAPLDPEPRPWVQETFEGWLSRTWADVVDHQDAEQKRRHVLAGTGVDFSKSPYMVTGVDLARYFLKHSAKNADGKEYQHVAPVEWTGGVGRYWGYWGLSKAVAGARLTEAEGYRVKRVLRRWDRANARHYGRRARRSLGGGRQARTGGWVLVDDPVRFVGLVLRAAGVPSRAGALVAVYEDVTYRPQVSGPAERVQAHTGPCQVCGLGSRVSLPTGVPWRAGALDRRHDGCVTAR